MKGFPPAPAEYSEEVGVGPSCCSVLPAERCRTGTASCIYCPAGREVGRRVAAVPPQSRSGDGAVRSAGGSQLLSLTCSQHCVRSPGAPRAVHCQNQLKQSVYFKHFHFCEGNNLLFLLTLNLLVRSCLGPGEFSNHL